MAFEIKEHKQKSTKTGHYVKDSEHRTEDRVESLRKEARQTYCFAYGESSPSTSSKPKRSSFA